jgi:excisionase family DNA binding protein
VAAKSSQASSDLVGSTPRQASVRVTGRGTARFMRAVGVLWSTVMAASPSLISHAPLSYGSAVSLTVAPQDSGVVMTQARDRLLTASEVADIFRVDRKTVTRWAADGLIKSTRTPGGHRRFRESDVRVFLGRHG